MNPAACASGVKRTRPTQPSSEHPQTADRELATQGYRNPVTHELLSAAMPLAPTFDRFDRDGVLDLSAWSEAQLATVPPLFFRSFPADGGLTVHIDANIRQLPAALLAHPMARLVFVNGPRDRQDALIDLCRIRGPEGGRPEVDVSALENAICVAPREWHDTVHTGGHCRLLDPSEVIFHGLYRTKIVHPALSDLDEHLLSKRSAYAYAQVERHLSGGRQLDVIRKASILLRLHLGKKVSGANANWISQGLLQLALNPADPPTTVELRFICQTLSHLADTLNSTEDSPWQLLADSLTLVMEAPFPDGASRANWCQSMLRKIAGKRGLSEGLIDQLFPLVGKAQSMFMGGPWLEMDFENTRKSLQHAAMEAIEPEVEAMDEMANRPLDHETVEELQHLISRDPGCLGRLQHFMREELGRQIEAKAALRPKDKDELRNRLTN